MALRLTIERSQNANRALYMSGYFRIFGADINKQDNCVRISVFSYPDEEARRWPDGASPISSAQYSVPIDKINLKEDIFAEAYKALKSEVEYFKKAEDAL